jgi:hypothetical protein
MIQCDGEAIWLQPLELQGVRKSIRFVALSRRANAEKREAQSKEQRGCVAIARIKGRLYRHRQC